jgi:PAS domain S-box-containing protein
LLFRSYPAVRATRETWDLLPIFALASGILATASGTLYLTWLAMGMERQRKIQRTLEDAQQLYQTLVEDAPEAILTLDPETMKFVDANPAAQSMIGLSREQCVQIGPQAINPPFQPDGRPSGETAAALINRAAAGENVDFEWVFRNSKGEDVECEVRLARISVSDKTLIRGSALDVSERRRAEERRRESLRELDHRVKNTLNTVLALATQTAATTATLDEFHLAFSGRVRALARAHEALASQHWRGAGIHEIATLVLGPYLPRGAERIQIAGRPTTLTAEAASALAMVLNELGTNAAKYGALSVPLGHVDVNWGSRADGTMVLEWQEHGGPMPAEGLPAGFGMKLIRGIVEHELAGALDSERHAGGMAYRITWPAEYIVRPENDGNENDGTRGKKPAPHTA